MRKLFSFSLILTCLTALLSCQKAVITDFNEKADGSLCNVTFNIRQFEQIPFDNAYGSRATDIKDLCSHINLAIFFGTERLKSESQKTSDSNFGTFSLNLDEGTYQALIVAHNQSKSPQTTNPEKIQFENDLTDVLYWGKEISIKADSSQTFDVDMHRQVAMIRFITTDSVPQNLASVKFYYTGGSAGLNAYTGEGSVNSKQTAIRTITSDMIGKPAVFEIYSIPKENNPLKIQVTGLDSTGNQIFELTFNNVAIQRNVITQYKGKLFTGTNGGAVGSSKFTLTTSDEWSTTEYEF